MSGQTDLRKMLQSLQPYVREGEFVYVVTAADMDRNFEYEAMINEDEGTTWIVRKDFADQNGLTYDYVAGWITLGVDSALDAVGLTAAFSRALVEVGVSCNVIAGYHHDHILVPHDRVADALAALEGLAAQ